LYHVHVTPSATKASLPLVHLTYVRTSATDNSTKTFLTAYLYLRNTLSDLCIYRTDIWQHVMSNACGY